MRKRVCISGGVAFLIALAVGISWLVFGNHSTAAAMKSNTTTSTHPSASTGMGSAVSTALVPYLGTWYSQESGITMVMKSDARATFTWAGNTVQAQFKASATGLNGTITASQAPNTGFHAGGLISLTRASDGGVIFNPYSAASETELYKPVTTTSAYAGIWDAPSGQLTINTNGTGNLVYRYYGSCPHPIPSGGLEMCNIIEQLHVSATTNGATVVVTSSTVEVSQGNEILWHGPSGIPSGTPYVLSSSSLGDDVLTFDMSGTPYGNGLFNICRQNSPADLKGTC